MIDLLLFVAAALLVLLLFVDAVGAIVEDADRERL